MAETAMQTTQPAEKQSLASLIASRKESFAAVAAKNFDPARLVKLGQAALSRNPNLLKCSPTSVLLCLMKCAELGLEPDSALPQRRMWLVPRWNNKLGGMECTYQIDYRAQLQLARDTGMVSSIVASEVREKDEWDYTLSPQGASMTSFSFKPQVFGDRGPVIGYFAAARLAGGEVQVVAMSKADAETHRDRFAQKTKDGKILGPWASDFDAMALKSCLRKLWNLLPAGQSEAAQKVQAAVAEEEAHAVEIVAEPAAPTGTSATAKVKAKLLAKKMEQAATPAIPPNDDDVLHRQTPVNVTDYQDAGEEPEADVA